MAGLQIRLSSAYRSIEKLDASSLPDFAILIGRNGVGKTQLLKALVEGIATASEIPRNEVEASIRHRISARCCASRYLPSATARSKRFVNKLHKRVFERRAEAGRSTGPTRFLLAYYRLRAQRKPMV